MEIKPKPSCHRKRDRERFKNTRNTDSRVDKGEASHHEYFKNLITTLVQRCQQLSSACHMTLGHIKSSPFTPNLSAVGRLPRASTVRIVVRPRRLGICSCPCRRVPQAYGKRPAQKAITFLVYTLNARTIYTCVLFDQSNPSGTPLGEGTRATRRL